MFYLREYISHYLRDEGTQAFGEYPLSYNVETVLMESNTLKEGFDIIGENMQLAYFNRDINEVNGAAWVGDNGRLFEFAVITIETAPNCVFENLVRDCMEEYTVLRRTNPELKLEIKIEDDETESHLREVYGLSVLGYGRDFAIMGFDA